MKELYYIQTRGFCGNSWLWWKPNRSGYCSNLDQAGKYTKEEAIEICKVRKDQDTMFTCSYIDAHCERHYTGGQ